MLISLLTVFFQEQFCLLKADGSGTVFFFAPTSRPAQLRSKWQESDLKNAAVSATFFSIATEV
jgi:hypothetical protein